MENPTNLNTIYKQNITMKRWENQTIILAVDNVEKFVNPINLNPIHKQNITMERWANQTVILAIDNVENFAHPTKS